jgi:site-specific DNA recombinase
MLRSSLYVGKLPYKGQEYEGRHEPIVEPELFAEAQELIRQRTSLPARSHQSQHLLSGLAHCGQCGQRLQAHYVNYLKDPSRRNYRSYRHVANQFTDGRACPGLAKSADKLEGLVVQAIREVSLNGDLLDQAFDEARRELASVPPSARQQQAELSSKLAELGGRFDRWAERLDAGEIDEEQFRARNAALLQEKAEIQR